ncbi:hypothetical protein CONLIGDRAFT_654007 [Coniochaeta ligniaria NRRL 30616]|uniref:FAD-binding FR-type domain-containing protein n=1 Tax=Coniochaeta ligniaria NRRL 30616 TaxID=1408157 RepID=A0A1J7IPV8_9PEZI|nr:hypothetical protein CONLIGDRAFT_654007 [Coniochaeta ligniaria NRRL 30616]
MPTHTDIIFPYIKRRRRQAAIILSDAEKGQDQKRWLYPYWTWTPSLKRSWTYAPLWKKRRASGALPLPTRLQFVFMASYFLLNLTYVILVDWSGSEHHIYPQLRKRSGTIAAANMVPLIVLAARNNPLIRILNISFDTCNFVHRWIGRIMILESLVHMMAWIYPKVTHEGWTVVASKITHSKFITTGVVGFISLLLIVLLSLRPLRSAAYETFKRIHILLALAFTGAIMAHCIVSLRPSQLAYVVTATALFGAERLTRLFWLYRRNLSRGSSTWATVEILPGQAQACRVTMHLPVHVNITPGMHAYLRLKAVQPWGSHPFSIAWWEHSGFFDNTKVSFIIAANGGFTKDLYDHAKSQPGLSFHTGAALEGPYGGHHSLDSYGTAVLFAGGTGIAHQIAYIRHFLEGHAAKKVATQRLVLIWVVRKTESIEWIRPWLAKINHMRTQHPDILQLRLFVTGGEQIMRHVGDGIGVKAVAGRPDIEPILEAEALEQVGAMCVSVCGPGGLADDVRAAVRDVQLKSGGQEIDFAEETFGW